MKKTLLTALVVSALASSAAFAGSSGNIKFSGTVTSETCNFRTIVNGSEQTEINLLTMSVNDAGGPVIHFSIAPESADCAKSTTGAVTWSGAGMNPDGLDNMAGTAKGIVVEIWATNNGDTKNKYVKDARQTIQFTNESGISSFDFATRLAIPTERAPTEVAPGTVETTVSYMVTYQ